MSKNKLYSPNLAVKFERLFSESGLMEQSRIILASGNKNLNKMSWTRSEPKKFYNFSDYSSQIKTKGNGF